MTTDSSNSQHDEYDAKTGNYKKRCYCERCKRTYDEWCTKNKEVGNKTCKRKCYTVCEIKCEKPVTTKFEWGYKKEYEGKWEKHDGKDLAKDHKKYSNKKPCADN